MRRTVDAAVADERRRLEELTRLAGVGSWEHDATRGSWSFTSVARALWGLPPTGTYGLASLAECVHPADRVRAAARWDSLLEQGTPLDIEVRASHDPTRMLHVRGARTFVGGRTVIVGSVEDVTERRAIETRLRTSSQRFTDLLAVAPVGVAIFDDHERLVQANQSLCRLLGEGQETLRGRRADELLDLAAETGTPTPLLARPAGSAGSISWSCAARALQRRERGARGTATEAVWCELHVSVSVDDAGHATHLVVFTDVTENRRVEASLRHQAMHDELTGLPNRRALTRTVSRLLAGPTARRTAVLFCDLDNFKRVNDSLGHDAGDELLVYLAERLREGLPPGCSATRHSGDEFVVVCADVDAHGGLDTLTEVVGKLLRTAVPVYGQLVRVSATIGAAVGAALGLPSATGEFVGDPTGRPGGADPRGRRLGRRGLRRLPRPPGHRRPHPVRRRRAVRGQERQQPVRPRRRGDHAGGRRGAAHGVAAAPGDGATTSWSCTTSRWSARTAACCPPRRWCAGRTRSAG